MPRSITADRMPMPREMTLQGRFERLAKAYFAERLHRPNMPIERESFSRAGTVVWEEDKKALVLDGGATSVAVLDEHDRINILVNNTGITASVTRASRQSR